MSTMRSGLEELRAEDLGHASEVRLMEDFEELERLARSLAVEADRRLAEIDRRRAWERDGHLSTGAWLVARFGMAWSVATRRIRTAVALEEMPSTREGVAASDVSPCAAQVLVAARDAHPQEFAEHEEILVQAAESLSVRDLRRAVGHWQEPLDGPKALDEAERKMQARRLYLSTTMGGMVRVDGDLDPETGQDDGASGGAGCRCAGPRGADWLPRAAARRCAGGGVPAVARPRGPSQGGRRTPARDRRDGRGCARRAPRRTMRARRRWSGTSRGGQARGM